jgi:hypothetical protein
MTFASWRLPVVLGEIEASFSILLAPCRIDERLRIAIEMLEDDRDAKLVARIALVSSPNRVLQG